MSESAKTHWEQIYATRSPELVSWYQAFPDVSLALIEAAEIEHNAPVIDVGGGASMLVDHLLGLGYSDVSVLDISGAALEHSQRRLGKRAEQVQWIESDIAALASQRRYALWHDRALFHFLTEAGSRRRYIEVLRAHLAPGAKLIIASFAPEGPDKCSGLFIQKYSAEKLMKELGKDFELLEERREDHATPGGTTQIFNYFLCGFLLPDEEIA